MSIASAPTGIGLRSPHYAEFAPRAREVALIEVHSENCFGGGRHLQALLDARRDCAVSLHGVGLSLGSTDALDSGHLAALQRLAARVDPLLVSDHLCWSSVGGVHVNDLLPLPYTAEALRHVARRVEQVQQVLGRRLLVENVSSYLEFREADYSEWDFLAELVRRSGCALLLDVNNVHVSASNHGFDARAYLDALPADAVAQFHLGGHSINPITLDDGRACQILIDTHGTPVCDAVWALYEHALRRFGARPTIVERDNDLPPLQHLLDEAAHAARLMRRVLQQEDRHDACAA
jgi:uncharacterized protein